jgi:brefeldin A-resistance guanine nucleotide exchange factor 1
LDCILRLHKLGLLPAGVASDAADDSEVSTGTVQGKPAPSSISTFHIPVMGTPQKSSGLMGRFIQLFSLDSEVPRSQPTEQQLAAHQRTLQTIQKCRIDSILGNMPACCNGKEKTLQRERKNIALRVMERPADEDGNKVH